MISIRSNRDLRVAYQLKSIVEDLLANHPEAFTDDGSGAREHLAEIKRNIRAYTHRAAREDILVRDYGMDGYAVRFPLPAWIETEEQANDYFESRYYMECRPSMYDCTGQLFTSWYTCKFWQGRWWAWHSVACDI